MAMDRHLKHRLWASVLLLFLTSLGLAQEPIQPLPQGIRLNEEKIALGERLYHDKRLSRDNKISCATCHPLSKAGADGLPVSVGIRGQKGLVNSPTVLNSGLNKVQFWDGRASTLEEQMDGPVNNPLEMGSDWDEVVSKLSKDPTYVDAFKKLYFQQGLTVDSIKDAIATYERSLITPNNAFDAYLRGDAEAISLSAKQGYALFKSVGCVACHNGINVGGQLFQKFGLFGDYFGDRAEKIKSSDYGRFNVTGNAADRFVFRVPSLRNVALTPPYFHDGSTGDLKEAVQIMAKYQLGKQLREAQVKAIVAFLETLSADPLPTSQYEKVSG